MMQIIYWLMLIAIIVLMAVIIYMTGGAFGAVMGIGFLSYLVYKNNKGDL